MMRDPNPKIVGISLRILENILDDLKSSEGQVANLISVVIEKLGDQKISIRQMVAKVIKELIVNYVIMLEKDREGDMDKGAALKHSQKHKHFLKRLNTRHHSHHIRGIRFLEDRLPC